VREVEVEVGDDVHEVGSGAGAVPVTSIPAPSSLKRRVVVRAWTYICLLDRATIRGEPVRDGDWRAFMAARGLKDAADDWSAFMTEAPAPEVTGPTSA